MDSEAVNMAAILVGFQTRPLLRFLKDDFGIFNTEIILTESIKKSFDKNQTVSSVLKSKTSNKFTQRTFLTAIILGVFLILGFGISHFIFPKKGCMQWTVDHYEMINCDLETNTLVNLNTIEPFDQSKCGLQKVKVCDTTKYFKNGQAIIWYAKTENGVEFFNVHGRHPENNKPLKPVTQYILKKYVKNK